MTSAINSIQPSGTAAVDDSRRANRANLDKAAQQFEAMFVNMMLKEARKTSFDGNLFNSDSIKTFRDMQDGQIAKEMGRHGSLGLAKAIADFLDRDGRLAAPAGAAATDNAQGNDKS